MGGEADLLEACVLPVLRGNISSEGRGGSPTAPRDQGLRKTGKKRDTGIDGAAFGEPAEKLR